MKRIEIEAWTLRIADSIKTNGPHEDSRVECKAEWISAEAAARRIAGHANAAGGEPILWLIGLDRQRGIIGASDNELSNWWSSVQSEFNEVAPSMTDILVPIDGKTIVALLIQTDRAPFVVKAKDGFLEVPWREGTRTNSARRSDFVRLLEPVLQIPRFEVLGGRIELRASDNPAGYRLELQLHIYLLPRNDRRVVFPGHYLAVSINFSDGQPILSGFNAFDEPFRVVEGERIRSETLRVSGADLIIDGPGSAVIKASMFLHDINEVRQEGVVNVSLRAAGSSAPAIQITASIKSYGPKSGPVRNWSILPELT